MKELTSYIHNDSRMDKRTKGLSVGIYQASTFHQDNVLEVPQYEYSRGNNPTREALEKTVANIEGADYGFAFASGMAAISSVFAIFKNGDHIIVCEDVYGGTFRITTKVFSNFGIDFTFVDASDVNNISNAIKENTKAIFIETPSNPLLKVTDIRAVSKVAKDNNLVSIIDNTFMTPHLQKPLDLGIDISVQSATKFLGGHSDVLAGVAVTRNSELATRIKMIQNSFGAVLGPQDSWILMRGIKTLGIRLEKQQKSAGILADFLSNHSNVSEVYYPSLKNHIGRDIHLSQALGGGAVLSFKTRTKEKAFNFLNNAKLCAVAVSLGGVETIASYPVTMSHSSLPVEERERLGITENLIRISPGLEDVEDLLEDFSNALK